jgi:hypothetical protein
MNESRTYDTGRTLFVLCRIAIWGDDSVVQALWDPGTSKQVLSSNQCWPVIETFS